MLYIGMSIFCPIPGAKMRKYSEFEELALNHESIFIHVKKLWSQTTWRSLVCEPSVLFGIDRCPQNSELCIAFLPLYKTNTHTQLKNDLSTDNDTDNHANTHA